MIRRKSSLKPETRTETYCRLAGLLAPAVADVQAGISEAIESPTTYVATHAERLRERAISGEAIRQGRVDLAWLALIDGLIEARLATEVDWKELPSNIRRELDALGSMPAASDRWAWAGHDDDLDAMGTEPFLKRCGKELERLGVELAYLDIGSDSYPLVLLESGVAREAQPLAASVGRALVAFARRKPRVAKVTLPRIPFPADSPAADTPARRWYALGGALPQDTPDVLDKLLWRDSAGRPTLSLEDLRAAADGAPEADRPLVRMVLRLFDEDPSEVARTTDDPEVLIAALPFRLASYSGTPLQRATLVLDAVAALLDRAPADRGALFAGRIDEMVVRLGPGEARAAFNQLDASLRGRITAVMNRHCERGAALKAAPPPSLAVLGDESSLRLLRARGAHMLSDALDVTLYMERLEKDAAGSDG